MNDMKLHYINELVWWLIAQYIHRDPYIKLGKFFDSTRIPTTHMRTCSLVVRLCCSNKWIGAVRRDKIVLCSLLHSDVVSFKLDYYWHVEFSRSTWEINRFAFAWIAHNVYARLGDILRMHIIQYQSAQPHSRCTESHLSNTTNLCTDIRSERSTWLAFIRSELARIWYRLIDGN